MWMNGGDMGWGWGFVGMAWMLLFWGSIVALVVWGIKRFSSDSNAPLSQMPLDIAKTRYARGEINQEEFEQLKRDFS